MTRLRSAFERANAERRAALVAYLTFGDPDPVASIDVVESACRAGADVIELGVPFSDPSADGPSIQRAMERALAAGATLDGALHAVAELRRRGIATPIVLFGYYNPVFVMGVDAFAARASQAGVDAVLTVDLPIDELGELAAPLQRAGVAVIPLVAPTSTPERIARVAAFAPPFVYYISLVGVTGAPARGWRACRSIRRGSSRSARLRVRPSASGSGSARPTTRARLSPPVPMASSSARRSSSRSRPEASPRSSRSSPPGSGAREAIRRARRARRVQSAAG